MIGKTATTLVFIPDCTGAPWRLDTLHPLSDRPRRTMTLPDLGEQLEPYAEYIQMKTIDLDRFVLVGDGFGAAVAVAYAARQPARLGGLVLTGALTSSPATDRSIKWLLGNAWWSPMPLSKSPFLKRIAEALGSPYNYFGDAPWNDQMTRHLYAAKTTRRVVIHRLRALLSANREETLAAINVPTLVIVPQDDPFLGNRGARVLLRGIPGAEGGSMRRTGPMLRYTHPVLFSKLVRGFLSRRVDPIRDETIERWYAEHSVNQGLVGTSALARLSAGSGLYSIPSRVWRIVSEDAADRPPESQYH